MPIIVRYMSTFFTMLNAYKIPSLVKTLGGFFGIKKGMFGNLKELKGGDKAKAILGGTFYDKRAQWTQEQKQAQLQSIDANVSRIAARLTGSSAGKGGTGVASTGQIPKGYSIGEKDAITDLYRDVNGRLHFNRDIKINGKLYKKGRYAPGEEQLLQQKQLRKANIGARVMTGVATGLRAGLTASTQYTKDGETYQMSEGTA